MKTLRLTNSSAGDILNDLLKRSPNNYTEYEGAVSAIVEDVRQRGDAAVFEYTQKFDKAQLDKDTVTVSEDEIREAYEQVDKDLLGVIRRSMANIRAYHEKQKRYGWSQQNKLGTWCLSSN